MKFCFGLDENANIFELVMHEWVIACMHVHFLRMKLNLNETYRKDRQKLIMYNWTEESRDLRIPSEI